MGTKTVVPVKAQEYLNRIPTEKQLMQEVKDKIARQKEMEKLYTKRVKKGIVALDKQFGRAKWLKRVKLSMLDLSNSYTCVCGQLFGEFSNMVFGKQIYDEISEEWQDEHGFLETHYYNYDLLTYTWFKEITKLKKA